MIYGLWLSAAGLQANQYRQDLIANNLANVETNGFKRDLAVFSERQVASREPFGDPTYSNRMLDSMTGGTFVAPTYTLYEQGPIQPTNRPLDLALQGDGFFTVRDGDRVAYTRDGALSVNANGELVTSAGGRPVLSDAGTPIRVPPGRASELQIASDGMLRLAGAEIGRLGLANFADPNALRKVGSNLFLAPEGATKTAPQATVMSGGLEQSAVDPATTMVAMIEAARAYQLNASLISLQDSMLGRAVNDIARLG
jgi:flagellar basal-body rod protein FlgF